MSYVIAGAVIASAALSYYNGQKQVSAQKKATEQAKASAEAQAKQADEAQNAANMASPDTNAMLSAAMLSGKAGASGTLLTGAQGIDKDKLNLSRSTLLGM